MAQTHDSSTGTFDPDGGRDPAGAQAVPPSPGAGSGPPATSATDYAILEGAFAAALAGVVALSRRRERQGAAPIPTAELPLLALATFALADVVAKEKVSTWLREPFVREDADHKPIHPEGNGLRHAVGELLTCTRCLGTWGALGLVGVRTASPSTGRVVVGVLALTGVNDALQAGFRLLTERADREALAAESARRALDANA